MSPALCFNLDQSNILSSSNGLMSFPGFSGTRQDVLQMDNHIKNLKVAI